MQLTAITDEISQDFEHALDVLAEYGARAAELRGLWNVNIADLTREDVRRAKRALSERAMRVACLATPFFKCDLDDAAPAVAGRMHLARPRGMDEQMAMLRRCCELAHAFDTDLIRVFTFWRRGAYTPDIEDRIVAAFDEPLRLAEREQVTLALENEHACYVGTGAEAARVLERLPSPNLRACWDPGNAYSAGETPYPDGYEAVRARVAHVHIKDGVMQPEGEGPRWCVVGEGDIDYPGHFAALARDGYAGFISLETHYIPAGGTPEDGSRPCLAALRRLIEANQPNA